jgi:hypothetical protein
MATAQPTAVHESYLRDLGTLIKEYALEAKARKVESESDFATGYMAGFHRVVSLMQQQADAFGIPRGTLSLDDIDPDRDLT